jgi:uncharacterized protein with GYD domain
MSVDYPLGGVAHPGSDGADLRAAARRERKGSARPQAPVPADTGGPMSIFIMLTRLTPDGVKTIKDNPSRVQEVNKEVEQLGVKVLNQWATLGEYDFVSVIEAPDEKVMAKLSIEMGSRGTVMNETLTAIDVEEFTSAL